MKPHSAYIIAHHDNPGGDIQFLNNLFVNGGDVVHYSNSLLPVVFDGNVYTKGSVGISENTPQGEYGEMNDDAEEQMKKYTKHIATETNAITDTIFDAAVSLSQQNKEKYIEMSFDKK